MDGWTTFLSSEGRNRDPQGVFKVENGTLHILDVPNRGQRQAFGYLATNRVTATISCASSTVGATSGLRPELGPKRDSGVVYHIQGGDRVWPKGVELQVQEGDTGDFWLLGGVTMKTTVASTGSDPKRYVRAAHRTRPGPGRTCGWRKTEPGERSGWNTVELTVRG